MNPNQLLSTVTLYEYISDPTILDCDLISFTNEKIIKLPQGRFSLKSSEALPFLSKISNKNRSDIRKSLREMKITGQEPLTLELLQKMHSNTSQEWEKLIESTKHTPKLFTTKNTLTNPQPKTPPPTLTEAQSTTDIPSAKTVTKPQFNDLFVSHCLEINKDLCKRIKIVMDYIENPENDEKCKKAIKAFETGIWPKEIIPELIQEAYKIGKNPELEKKISEHQKNNNFLHGCAPVDKTAKPILIKKIHQPHRNKEIYFLLEHDQSFKKHENVTYASKALKAFRNTTSIMSYSCILQIALFRAMHDHLGEDLFDGIFSPDQRSPNKPTLLLADFSARSFTFQKNPLHQYSFLEIKPLNPNHDKFLKGTIYGFETTPPDPKRELFALCSKKGSTKKGINDNKIFIHPFLTPELTKDKKYIPESLPHLSTHPNYSYTFQFDNMQKAANTLRPFEFLTEISTSGNHKKQRKKAEKHENSARTRPKEKKHLNSNLSPGSPLVPEVCRQQGSPTLMPFSGQTDTTNNTNSSFLSLTSESKTVQRLSLDAKHDRTDQKAMREDILSNPSAEALYEKMNSLKRAVKGKSNPNHVQLDVSKICKEIRDLIKALKEHELLTEKIQKHIDAFYKIVEAERIV